MKRKWYSYVGNALTIIALVFVVRKILMLDINYEIISRPKNVLYLILFSALYGIHIFLVGISWKQLLKVTTNVSIPFEEVSLVWCRANLLKYIPGNIFQYVGRNDIAVKKNLSHIEVGFSTVLDVGMNVLGVLIIGVICYMPGVKIWLNSYNPSIKINDFKVLSFIIIIFTILIIIFRNKFKKVVKKISKIFLPKNIAREMFCLLYYMFWAVYTGYIFVLVCTKMVGMQLDWRQTIVILGAFLLSWIVGFIMPGAPGGIGIREAALAILLSNQFEMEMVLLGIVIYRLANIGGDFLGLLYSQLYSKIKRRKRERINYEL